MALVEIRRACAMPPTVSTSSKGQLHKQGGKCVAIERCRAQDEKNKIIELIKQEPYRVIFSGEKGFEHLNDRFCSSLCSWQSDSIR